MRVLINNNNNPSVFFALCTKIDVIGLPPSFTPATPSLDPPSCCENGLHAIPVFGDLNSNDKLKNDYSAFVQKRDISAENWEYSLEKFETGSWVHKADLDGTNAYAVLRDWAKYDTTAEFKDATVFWKPVLTDFDSGYYRVVAQQSGLGTTTWYSQIYCLGQFTDICADSTVRFDWTLKGVKSAIYDRFSRIDYGNLNLKDSIRVPGSFGQETNDVVRTETKLSTGALKDTSDRVTIKWTFVSRLLNIRTHVYLAYNAFLSDDTKASDFTLLNDDQDLKNIEVKYNSGYTPKYFVQNKASVVNVEFKNRTDIVGTQIC